MSAKLRVKVPVSVLIEKVTEAKAKVEAKYQAELDAFPAKQDEWRAAVRAAAERVIAAVDAGKDPKLEWNDRIKVPAKPVKPSKTSTARYDRDLGLLTNTTDEVLSISSDSDFAGYL